MARQSEELVAQVGEPVVSVTLTARHQSEPQHGHRLPTGLTAVEEPVFVYAEIRIRSMGSPGELALLPSFDRLGRGSRGSHAPCPFLGGLRPSGRAGRVGGWEFVDSSGLNIVSLDRSGRYTQSLGMRKITSSGCN